jgi:catechol 2,3-dioxygenase-like lactoylglutathione lyase family enzyme
MFGDDYLELLGILDPTQFTNNLDKPLEEKGEGLLGVSFATEDAEAAHAQLSGLGAEPPKDLKRLLDLPEGTLKAAFRLVHLPPEATPGMPAFLCQHLSRGVAWRADWLDHANGAVGIAAVTARVEDLDQAHAAYGALFGAGTVSRRDGDVLIKVGGGQLRLRAAGPDAPEGLEGLDIAVEDIGRTVTVLEQAEITHQHTDNRITVAAIETCGVALGFVPAIGA